MKDGEYQFQLYGKVTDEEALHDAALARAIEEGGDAEKYGLKDEEGEIDVRVCLRVLLDPGSLPGFEIIDSCAE